MIQLPKLFEDRLKKNENLYADITKSLKLFEPWLEQSGMPFFPGFTDHSPRHINDVLTTASSLLSDDAHALLSSEDVAVLVLAVLLHDSGMHLTQDGFRALVQQTEQPLRQELGDRPWQTIWHEFLAEASRFGEERLISVFGDGEPINIEEFNISDLSERDCLLIGEFVRRHHARLAHEIAIDRVPMLNGNGLQLIGLDDEIKDLAGLIARSHGMSIRSTFPYIEAKYVRVAEYRRIKTPFLMAVLRISDYVQVQSERALKSLLSVKELRSPMSRQEWRNHFAVRDVTTRISDPEAMFVHATPSDAQTYLRLDSLFKDIQRELDDSWATLGEVYGRLGELSRLGLTIRRLRSNLDDREQFSKSISYIPIKAHFASSGPELLKLLVGPLYNYDYSVGIRELVQNAIDACKERADLKGDASAEVVVEIDESEDGSGWVTVRDSGVGMTLDTVTNYFLIAGASFRNSDVWKQQHTDASGKSRVLRGGRFGVGALAAFLLGEQITVRTRHVERNDADGIEFTAKIDDPVIELRKARVPAGTSISVWVSKPEVMKNLRPLQHSISPEKYGTGNFTPEKWEAVDWYAQLVPKVTYKWAGFVDVFNYASNKEMKQRANAVFTPTQGLVPLEDSPDWHTLPDPTPYKKIIWQYPPDKKGKHGDHEYTISEPSHIVVNGIRVQSFLRHTEECVELSDADRFEGPQFRIERPSMAIYDPAGLCPINLQRSAVAFDRMGTDDRLAKSILQSNLKALLALAPKVLTLQAYEEFARSIFALRGVSYPFHTLPPLCATNSGLFLASPRFFKALNIQTVFFTDTAESLTAATKDFLADGEAIFVRSDDRTGEQATLSWFRSIYGALSERWRVTWNGFPDLEHVAEFGYLTKDEWKFVNIKGKVRRNILSRLEVQSEKGDLVLVRNKHSTLDIKNVDALTRVSTVLGPKEGVSAWALSYPDEDRETASSPLGEEWVKMVGGPLLRIS